MRGITQLAILLVAVTATVGAPSAAAESAICLNLQHEYFAATHGSTPIPAAVNGVALRASLATAEAAASANHCRSFGIFSPGPTGACPAVMNEVLRLQTSLRQLTGGNGPTGFFSFAPALRSPADQLRDALVANGCDAPDSNSVGYRALCVRACDGYYFPVNSGGGTAGSPVDAAACEATYGGGAKAELFVGPLSGDVANTRSLSGSRYGDQPYAFSYRTKYNAVCVAQLQDGVSALASRDPIVPIAALTMASAPLPPIPQMRPRFSEDAQTVAAFGEIMPASFSTPIIVGPSPVMRVVGAGYYNIILDQADAAARRASASHALQAPR
jgi:hypothetical protein